MLEKKYISVQTTNSGIRYFGVRFDKETLKELQKEIKKGNKVYLNI